MLAFIVPDVGNDDALAVVQEIVIAHVGSDIELFAIYIIENPLLNFNNAKYVILF